MYTTKSAKIPWWRHQMETFSALLVLCAEKSPVPGEFPAQRPVTRSFDVFFDLRRNKRLSKQSWGWWFETLSHPLWRHCNASFFLWCRPGDKPLFEPMMASLPTHICVTRPHWVNRSHEGCWTKTLQLLATLRSLVSHCGVLCASFKFWHIMIFCFVSVSKIVLLHFDFRTTYLYHDLFIYTGWHVCGISISMNCYFLFLFCAIQQSNSIQNIFSAEGKMMEELHYPLLLYWMFFAIPVYFVWMYFICDDKPLSWFWFDNPTDYNTHREKCKQFMRCLCSVVVKYQPIITHIHITWYLIGTGILLRLSRCHEATRTNIDKWIANIHYELWLTPLERCEWFMRFNPYPGYGYCLYNCSTCHYFWIACPNILTALLLLLRNRPWTVPVDVLAPDSDGRLVTRLWLQS